MLNCISDQPTYKENVTVEVEKLNITSNSTVTHDVVKIITEQLTARFNSSILGTPIVTIKSANGTVVIEVNGNKQIDLDDDLINSRNGKLQKMILLLKMLLFIKIINKRSRRM